jgi:hypothetical protein
MPLQLLAKSERVALTESPRAYPRADRIADVRALGWVDRMGGYSVETRAQRKRAAHAVRNPVRVDGWTLDNDHVRLSVASDGRVLLADRATGREIHDLLRFEQRVEAGDLYTPAPRAMLAAPQLRRVRATMRGPLRGELTLSYLFGDGARGRGRCTMRLQLDAALPAVRIALDGENRDRDHRVRLCIATGLTNAATLVDAAFHPLNRVPLSVPEEEQRAEHVVPTAPLHRWVTRFGTNAGVTVFSDGLAEYESQDDGTVAITLFRAVGELSRADIPERPGHAGWPAPTPGAQAIGPYRARFAVAMHDSDDWRTRETIEQLADDVLLPIRGETLRYNLADPHIAGGLELAGDGLAFSTAAPGIAAGWVTLRCVNRREVPVNGHWRIGRHITEAVRARLDETPGEVLAVRGDVVEFVAAPLEIVTILVR